VSNKPLEEGFVQKLNKALQLGVEEIPQLLYLLPTPQPGFDMRKYFVENISYELDVAKRRGLDRFLSEMTSQQVVAPHTERYLVAE
jgi:chorismate dehydratase